MPAIRLLPGVTSLDFLTEDAITHQPKRITLRGFTSYPVVPDDSPAMGIGQSYAAELVRKCLAEWEEPLQGTTIPVTHEGDEAPVPVTVGTPTETTKPAPPADAL